MPAFKKVLRAVARGCLWLLREGIPATALLIAAGLLIWTIFGVNQHKLALSAGDYGDYGVIELPEIGPNVAVLEFSAIRVPSRVISYALFPTLLRGALTVVWPVPPTLEVTVRYQGPDKAVHEWTHTYFIACTKDGRTCKTVDALRGVSLYGRGPKGGAVDRGWVYFLQGVRPPQEEAQPGAVPQFLPPSQPSPPPLGPPRKPQQSLPPGVLIA